MRADVIKVKVPGEGDGARRWGPIPERFKRQAHCTGQLLHGLQPQQALDHHRHCHAHEDQALIREMAVLSDVLVENLKAGGLKKYGLDYESLHALNHPLIYCSVTALARMVLMPNMQAAT